MSVSVGPEALLALLACAGYGLATLRGQEVARLPSAALVAGWLLHGAALAVDISGWGTEGGARFGFAPALSGAVWLVLAVHAVESRFVPLPGVRRALAAMGVIVSGLIIFFPGEVALKFSSPLTPLHLLLGIASYGLFGAAVIHGVMLDSAERALRRKPGAAAVGSVPGSATGSTAPFTATPALGPHPTLFGLPLMRLERLTFRFVEAGFVVLSLALLMGWLASLWGHAAWRWDHKTVFSLLGWATFAALIAGRHLKGWRGRRATRWLYAGAGLLVLAYIGSRFVAEVVLNRVTPT
ncbi:MAG: cytochrome c biogenesis protein CcsA [Burkholderiales bacterium]|nr:cytochrome c biogenesis protein CcsA [Burkholderiales bacterium]